ncbi:hypothetical protein FGB62_107g125 [Gracilaria domingensis]|nr:hypothetical protein FGB62_107g125 [Gracilaria domingensis]
MYEARAAAGGGDENQNPNVSAMVTPPRGVRRQHRSQRRRRRQQQQPQRAHAAAAAAAARRVLAAYHAVAGHAVAAAVARRRARHPEVQPQGVAPVRPQRDGRHVGGAARQVGRDGVAQPAARRDAGGRQVGGQRAGRGGGAGGGGARAAVHHRHQRQRRARGGGDRGRHVGAQGRGVEAVETTLCEHCVAPVLRQGDLPVQLRLGRRGDQHQEPDCGAGQLAVQGGAREAGDWRARTVHVCAADGGEGVLFRGGDGRNPSQLDPRAQGRGAEGRWAAAALDQGALHGVPQTQLTRGCCCVCFVFVLFCLCPFCCSFLWTCVWCLSVMSVL